MTLVPTLIVLIGEFGAEVGQRLKSALWSTHAPVRALFPLLLISERTLNTLNQHPLPAYIPMPKWEPQELFRWSADLQTTSLRARRRAFREHSKALQQAIENRLAPILSAPLRREIEALGWAVGTPDSLPLRIVLVGSLTESLTQTTLVPIAQLARHILEERQAPGYLLAVCDLASWTRNETLLCAYATLQTLRDTHLLDRCYLIEGECPNGMRVSQPEDQAEAVALFLMALVHSTLYNRDALFRLIHKPPDRLSWSSGNETEVRCEFASFGVNGLVFPRRILRTLFALRLGTRLLETWQSAPKPEPIETDRECNSFLGERFQKAGVRNYFEEQLRKVSEAEYLPTVYWERLRPTEWANAIASADAFCGQNRIRWITKQLEHAQDQLLGEFSDKLQTRIISLLREGAEGRAKVRPLLEALLKECEQVSRQMSERPPSIASDLSPYHQALQEAVGSTPKPIAPYLSLVPLSTLLLSWLWLTPMAPAVPIIGTGAVLLGGLSVGGFTNWYFHTKCARLREEYWQAVRQKWHAYLQYQADYFTFRFFQRAVERVHIFLNAYERLERTLNTVKAEFERVQTEILEEQFVTRRVVHEKAEREALYDARKPDQRDTLTRFTQALFAENEWRDITAEELAQRLFEHAYASWHFFENYTLEQWAVENQQRASELFRSLRQELQPLLRVPTTWQHGAHTEQTVQAIVLATQNGQTIFLRDQSGSPYEPLYTNEQEHALWIVVRANFPMEMATQVAQWEQEWLKTDDSTRAECAPDEEGRDVGGA